MIKAIIFDCFGVLTTDSWRAFTATLPPDQRDRASELNRAYDAGMISLAEFLQGIQEATGRQPDLIENLLDNDIVKNTALLKYIAELKPHYKIGMISNIATNWVREKLLTPEEQQLFNDMVFSYEVRVAKPDPRIFHLATQRLGVEANECVFIDDIDRYCEVATEVGMRAIVYQDFGQMQADLTEILNDKAK